MTICAGFNYDHYLLSTQAYTISSRISIVTLPFFNTKILSALWIVESLCAITIVVLFLVKLLIAVCTTSSESASREDVASSSNIIGDFLRIARAIDILCF